MSEHISIHLLRNWLLAGLVKLVMRPARSGIFCTPITLAVLVM